MIEEARHKQEELNSYLTKIRIGNKLKNKKDLKDDYNSMILEAKREAGEKEPEVEQSKGKTKPKNSLLELPKEFKN